MTARAWLSNSLWPDKIKNVCRILMYKYNLSWWSVKEKFAPFRQFHFPFVCLLLSPLQMQKWVVICWAVLAVVGADVCPDGGLCKEGETCCNSPANGYGCCRYENVRPGVIIPCNLSVHDNVITFIVLVLIGFLFAVRVGGGPQRISIWVYVLLVTHLNQVLMYENLTISKNKTKNKCIETFLRDVGHLQL